VLTESAVDEREISKLETLLSDHGVVSLVAGIRQPSGLPSPFPNNYLHIGFNPNLEKGGLASSEGSEPCFTYGRTNTTAGRSTDGR
jgi:hypothetical protein